MDRRKFVTHTIAGSVMLSAGGVLLNSCKASKKHLTILHTNDVHSHIEAFPKNHADFPGLGGLARRAGLVQKIRKENPNTLLLDAGDIFQGTPYFNFYGGELEFKLMSMLRYDAATIGNHDFDNGIDGLLAQLPYASFDFLIANYDFTNTVLDGYTKPYKTYIKDGLKVGIYGLGINLAGLVTKKLYKETEYLGPYEVATDIEALLKITEKCDIIICLSHLGYSYENENRPDDLKLGKRTKYTDLIIGGHTHTFLERPTVVTNANGRGILVNQVGCFGVNVGRVDFYFDEAGGSAEGVTISV
ncbi:bifunctional metallophosphatase/5'-nucleotidase [Maribacter aurantiacus]|uniref:Bifunctional metallophosphatase/5'-nucleotidase n=1 Tax=Maribacter aurantiacus TaxID=1882343 RepID=A0A5R8M854_9FLAO|nr:metallophosphatase [Maribacter aurantiacus]TLF44939.1 bifunctional metallophosphatase/5'-nucleotidase [Maribacter aurantiacus]